jgi:glycerophosphoryl diester phosphodiesterase
VRRVVRILTTGLVVALVVVAGCSGDDDSGGSSSDPTPTTNTTEPSPTADVASLFGQDRALAIAHAGGERDYPKETLFAFGEATLVGADVLELDVHLSADGDIVVIHDDTVDGTTNSTGRVADLTTDELADLDAAYWFAPGCGTCHDEPTDAFTYRGIRDGDQPAPDGYAPADFGVTTFREVATRFPDMPLDVEIKPEGDTGVATAEALAREIADLDRTDSTVVVSFDQAVVDAFRGFAPDVAVSPGIAGTTDWFLQGASLDGYSVLQVPPTYESVNVVTPETVARAHAEGLDVWVWMNDASQETPEFYSQMFDMGVDGIIGDHPEELAGLVSRR